MRWNMLNKINVPEIILGLTSKDIDVRKKSLKHLDGEIIRTHVLDGYGSENDQIDQKHLQLLLLVVPMLIELLKYDYVEDKHMILALLDGTICHYEYSLRFHETQPWRIDIAKEIVRLVAQGMPIYESQTDSLSSRDQVESIKTSLSEFDWL